MASADPTEPLPPYAFVPGGPWPHPVSSPQGHSFGRTAPAIALRQPAPGARLRAFRRGVDLFNAGYYWEAHEAWEGLWHSLGRRGAAADIVKALIKLAAAGVKVREGQEHGVRTHAGRAALLFSAASTQVGRRHLGLDLDQLAERAGQVSADPPRDPSPAGAAVSRVFAFQLQIDPASALADLSSGGA
jgi:hypothetical protein